MIQFNAIKLLESLVLATLQALLYCGARMAQTRLSRKAFS